MKNNSLKYLVFFLGCCLMGCEADLKKSSAQDVWGNRAQIPLMDFEEKNLPTNVEGSNGTQIELITNTGVTKGTQALKINFEKHIKAPTLKIKFDHPIAADSLQDFSLVFDVINLTENNSLQLYTTVFNEKGNSIRKGVALPSKIQKTCFIELKGKYVDGRTGLRDDPIPFDTEAIHMKTIGGRPTISYSKVGELQFWISHPMVDKSMVIDNIRLVTNPEIKTDYLVGEIDKYGQPAKRDFPGKINSDEQLKQLADQELKQLTEEGNMPGRSKFGGWADGPKLKATGFFRTEKVDKKWTLVDPEGNVFFSTGIANVRMANTTTFTGVDFKNDKIRYRDPDDVTPEDSRGMIRLEAEITTTAFVAHPERHQMFLDLPSYDSPLANHFSYRKDHYNSPFKQGETYSHYQANLERRYGEATPNAHLKKWEAVTLDRLLNWGFTSFGNWTGYEFYQNEQLPYFANGWIIGDFKTIPSGYWGADMPDVFDPKFKKRAKITVEVIAEEVKNNPWCIGVFIDNEKAWGLVHDKFELNYAMVFQTLLLPSAESPAKAVFVKKLKKKYKTIKALNTAWENKTNSWQTFENGIDFKNQTNFNPAFQEDIQMLQEVYAMQYFSIVHDALEKVMPNHLYMGCRIADWGSNKATLNVAKKYCDVVSYNFYEEGINEKDWKFLEDLDRPSLIGEFHFGTLESGMFHGGLMLAANHEDRGKKFKTYMESVIDNPYFVGAHWFQYTDSPVAGRAYDGENYNVGFVTNTDVPYPTMVKAAKEVNSNLYSRRFNK